MSIQISGTPSATTTVAGLMSAADKSTVNNARLGWVNVLDYGADNTGVADCSTAFTNAMHALPSGGIVFMPAGTYNLAATLYCDTAGITFLGASRSGTIVTSSFDGSTMVPAQAYVSFENFTITTSAARSNINGYAIATTSDYASCSIRRMNIKGTPSVPLYNGIMMSSNFMDIDDVDIRYFAGAGITVYGTSDFRINRALMDNSSQAMSGILVQQAGSLLVSNVKFARCGSAFNAAPLSGNTVANVSAVNCIFDAGTYGVCLTPGNGFIYRSRFANMWCANNSSAGFLFNGTGTDGISLDNCDFYTQPYGIQVSATNGTPGCWTVSNSRFAAHTNYAITLIGGSAHQPFIIGCHIGPQSGYAANQSGINLANGTYKGLRIESTRVVNNTSVAMSNIGALTVATADSANFAVINCPGINGKTAITTPSVPASNTAVYNTTGFRCMVYMKGGTISAISVGGNATNLATATPLLVEPGAAVVVTYSFAFTWVWVAQ